MLHRIASNRAEADAQQQMMMQQQMAMQHQQMQQSGMYQQQMSQPQFAQYGQQPMMMMQGGQYQGQYPQQQAQQQQQQQYYAAAMGTPVKNPMIEAAARPDPADDTYAIDPASGTYRKLAAGWRRVHGACGGWGRGGWHSHLAHSLFTPTSFSSDETETWYVKGGETSWTPSWA